MGEKIGLPHQSLVLVMGVAGSGKTALSHAIVRRVHMVYLNSDAITEPFFPDTRDTPQYLTAKPRIYDALYALARENLAMGNSVLVDAPHGAQVQSPDWARFMTDMSNQSNASLKIIRCWCAADVLHKRLAERAEPRDRPKLNDWSAFLADHPVLAAIPLPHLDVNTDEPLEVSTSLALSYLLGPSEKQPR